MHPLACRAADPKHDRDQREDSSDVADPAVPDRVVARRRPVDQHRRGGVGDDHGPDEGCVAAAGPTTGAPGGLGPPTRPGRARHNRRRASCAVVARCPPGTCRAHPSRPVGGPVARGAASTVSSCATPRRAARRRGVGAGRREGVTERCTLRHSDHSSVGAPDEPPVALLNRGAPPTTATLQAINSPPRSPRSTPSGGVHRRHWWSATMTTSSVAAT